MDTYILPHIIRPPPFSTQDSGYSMRDNIIDKFQFSDTPIVSGRNWTALHADASDVSMICYDTSLTRANTKAHEYLTDIYSKGQLFSDYMPISVRIIAAGTYSGEKYHAVYSNSADIHPKYSHVWVEELEERHLLCWTDAQLRRLLQNGGYVVPKSIDKDAVMACASISLFTPDISQARDRIMDIFRSAEAKSRRTESDLHIEYSRKPRAATAGDKSSRAIDKGELCIGSLQTGKSNWDWFKFDFFFNYALRKAEEAKGKRSKFPAVPTDIVAFRGYDTLTMADLSILGDHMRTYHQARENDEDSKPVINLTVGEIVASSAPARAKRMLTGDRTKYWQSNVKCLDPGTYHTVSIRIPVSQRSGWASFDLYTEDHGSFSPQEVRVRAVFRTPQGESEVSRDVPPLSKTTGWVILATPNDFKGVTDIDISHLETLHLDVMKIFDNGSNVRITQLRLLSTSMNPSPLPLPLSMAPRHPSLIPLSKISRNSTPSTSEVNSITSDIMMTAPILLSLSQQGLHRVPLLTQQTLPDDTADAVAAEKEEEESDTPCPKRTKLEV